MAIIEFIKKPPKTKAGLRRLINYITNLEKTQEHLIGGYNCDSQNAYFEFMNIKEIYHKTDGIQARHFIQSFKPDESLTPEIAKEIADKLVQYADFKEFQLVYAVHVNTEHLHTHFVINSVNNETGLRWHQTDTELQELKNYSDKLCEEYGLNIITKKEKGHRSQGEYRNQKKSSSWKHELFLAVKHCSSIAISKDDFINKMADLGYKVLWTDKKYITFITPDNKKCRNNKLYPQDRFSKEKLLDMFENNKRIQDERIKISNQIQNELERRKHWNNFLSVLSLFSGSNDKRNKKNHYPLSYLEGEALKEELLKLQNQGEINWDDDDNEDYEL